MESGGTVRGVEPRPNRAKAGLSVFRDLYPRDHLLGALTTAAMQNTDAVGGGGLVVGGLTFKVSSNYYSIPLQISFPPAACTTHNRATHNNIDCSRCERGVNVYDTSANATRDGTNTLPRVR